MAPGRLWRKWLLWPVVVWHRYSWRLWRWRTPRLARSLWALHYTAWLEPGSSLGDSGALDCSYDLYRSAGPGALCAQGTVNFVNTPTGRMKGAVTTNRGIDLHWRGEKS